MASQLRRVTGNPSRRTGVANAKLQARINRLPQMLQNRQSQAILKRDTAFQNSQIALQRSAAKQRKREQEAGMGLEASKLGVNLAMSDMGGKTLGDITRGAKDLYGNAFKKGYTNKAVPTGAARGWQDKVSVGGALSSGLTGYGVGKLVGGKSKTKKSLYGGGAGALLGMLSAPKGGGMMGGLVGGGLGALGGYFS